MPVGYQLERTRFRSTMISTSISVGLFTRPPAANDAGTELIGNGYVRATTEFAETLNLCGVNTRPVLFTATAPWPVARFFGLFDPSGNLLFWDQLFVAVSLASGAWLIPAGQLFVDWLNRISQLPITVGTGVPAAKGNLAAEFTQTTLIDVTSTLPVLTAVPSLQLPSGKWMRKASQQQYRRLSVVTESVIGTYLVRKLLDATRASGAGFTVTSPDGLAF
jgi:hypothetical protein